MSRIFQFQHKEGLFYSKYHSTSILQRVINSLRPSDAYNASVQHTNIGSGNGLSPVQDQAIIWTNAAILSMRPKRAYFSEISFKIQKLSFKEMHLKMSVK